MRYTAFAFFVGLAFALAANELFAAGIPTVSHGAGVPATGSQNGFGRTGTTPPNYNSGFSPGAGATSPISTAAPTLNGPTSGGAIGTSSSGLPSASGFGSENNAYPLTNPQGGGQSPETSGAPAAAGSQAATNATNPAIPNLGANNPATTSGASGAGAAAATAPEISANAGTAAARANMRYFQGRWWYPMVGGHWVYWDDGTSSWVFFSPTATAIAENTPSSGQYSSGYRGLGTEGNNAAGTSPINRTGWYWRGGAWYWFNGRTFRAATAAK